MSEDEAIVKPEATAEEEPLTDKSTILLIQEMLQLMNSNLQRLGDQLGAVTGQITELWSGIPELKGLMTDMNSGIADVRLALNGMQSELSLLRRESADSFTTLDRRFGTIAGEIMALKADLRFIENHLDKQESKPS
ncbi:MAG TPA: hypothetical protein VN345_05345 [Blastocatellia bacterium]|jgi:hypothetical protein|nr:hypothetical protein [Blastocatellia bacterium]